MQKHENKVNDVPVHVSSAHVCNQENENSGK